MLDPSEEPEAKAAPAGDLPSYALRHVPTSRGGGGLFFLKSEKRDMLNTGRAGGYFERLGAADRNLTHKEWDSDEEQFDEFGRKKRKKSAAPKKASKTQQDKEPPSEKKPAAQTVPSQVSPVPSNGTAARAVRPPLAAAQTTPQAAGWAPASASSSTAAAARSTGYGCAVPGAWKGSPDAGKGAWGMDPFSAKGQWEGDAWAFGKGKGPAWDGGDAWAADMPWGKGKGPAWNGGVGDAWAADAPHDKGIGPAWKGGAKGGADCVDGAWLPDAPCPGWDDAFSIDGAWPKGKGDWAADMWWDGKGGKLKG